MSLRAHAASAVSLATGWTNLSGSFACTTPTGLPAEQPGAPRRRRREDAGGLPSRFTLMVRESEYTDEVDFLDNHNAADTNGLAAFVTNTVHGPLNRTGPAAFAPVPITQYCVEHLLPGSLDDNGGFADYASCNAPEAGCYPVPGWEQRCPLALPTCGCWNFADRIIGHQTAAQMAPQCGECQRGPGGEGPPLCSNPPSFGPHGQLDGRFPQCNCTAAPGVNATLLNATSPTANYVGRAPVFLPYGPGVGPWMPPEAYPPSKRCGNNFSLLKKRSCAEGVPLGTDGCTWRRLSVARVVYGAELTAAGWEWWRPSPEHRGHNTTAVTLHNAAVLEKVLGDDSWMEPLELSC